MAPRRAISKRLQTTGAAVLLVLLAAAALYYFPTAPGLEATPAFTLTTSSSSSSTSASTSQSTSATTSSSSTTSTSSKSTSSTQPACKPVSPTSNGNISFVVTPRNSFLSPGLDENLTLTIYAHQNLTGMYQLSYLDFAWQTGDLGASFSPSCVDLSTGSAVVTVHVRASPVAVPYKDDIALILTGPEAYYSHAFPVQVVPYMVQILDQGFRPSSESIPKGGTVVWFVVSGSQTSHQVQVCSGQCGQATATSPTLSGFQNWNYTFGGPGTYQFVDVLRPGASGTITVNQ